jgi:hypothetical protein
MNAVYDRILKSPGPSLRISDCGEHGTLHVTTPPTPSTSDVQPLRPQATCKPLEGATRGFLGLHRHEIAAPPRALQCPMSVEHDKPMMAIKEAAQRRQTLVLVKGRQLFNQVGG